MTDELFREDPYLRTCAATVTGVDDEGVYLDQTVFYPTGGGQPGDTGHLLVDDRELSVEEAASGSRGVLHRLGPDHGLNPGDAVTATIDWARRHRHMRMHTTMHLLCSLVDGDVTGGALTDVKARLDFDLPDPTLDKAVLTAGLLALVEADHPVETEWVTDAELEERPELVRTMSVRPPRGVGRVRLVHVVGVDLQACGGTHVARTSEIARVRVKKIEKKGARNRRVRLVFDD